MHPLSTDTAFAGSIPKLYERYLVPLIFEPYAADLALRIVPRHPSRVLEIAAGTGVVTRQLAEALPPAVSIVATDLNQAMLNQAAAEGTSRPVEWRQADALHLPFPDEFFDVVVCQFGVMFFPDKVRAYAEARRVLRPGGQFIFNVWDRIDHNDFANTVTHAVGTLFPDDPPRFLARVPHGYHDLSVIAQDLARGDLRSRPRGPRWPRAAGLTRRTFPRWRTAKAHRFAARSRRAALHVWPRPLISRRPQSRISLARQPWTGRFRRTSWLLNRSGSRDAANEVCASPMRTAGAEEVDRQRPSLRVARSRQHVAPLPQLNSFGNNHHDYPARRPKTMPVNGLRPGTRRRSLPRLRPLLRQEGFDGLPNPKGRPRHTGCS
jgi:SAM-dependent methyltransferase